MRWFLALLVAAVVAVLIGTWVLQRTGSPGPALPEASRVHPQGGWFQSAVAEPDTLNPFVVQGAVARRYVLRHTHDSLMELDARSGQLRPALAELVSSSEDGLEHEFVLREGARFSDGQLLSIEDVLFGYELSRSEHPLGAAREAFQLVRSAEAVGPDRLRIELVDPSFVALGKVATGWTVCQSSWFRRELSAGRSLSAIEESGPGTGAYAVAPDGWRRGIDLTLVRNPHSWRRAAEPERHNLAGLRFRFVSGDAARWVALRNEEIDWMVESDSSIGQRDPRIAERYRPLAYDHAYLGPIAVLWNHRRGPLGRPSVRRALTMAIDRERVVRDLMHDKATVPATWFKPGSDLVPPDLVPWPHDLEESRRLLAAEGFSAESPLELNLLYASSESLHREIVDLIVPAMVRVGVKIESRAMPWAGLAAKLGDRDFDAMLVVISSDPWSDPSSLFVTDGGRNWIGMSDPEVDRWLPRARRSLDPVERAGVYTSFARRFHRDQPMTLVAFPLSSILLHRRFQGVRPGPMGIAPQCWWVDPSDRLPR